MIRRDHQRVPVRSVAAFLVLFCIAPLIFPHLLPYQVTGEMIVASQRTAIDAAMTSSLGIAAGMGVCLLQYTYKQFNKGRNLSFDIASWVLIGCGLGWQAVTGIFFLSVITHLLPDILPTDSQRNRNSNSLQNQWLILPTIVLLHQCLWRVLAEYFPII